MLTSAYVFMVFALAMCGLTIFNGLKEKALAADAEQRKAQVVPSIEWTASSPDGLFLQCKANGKDTGVLLDCRTYQTCNSSEGNRRVCAGVYYPQAIAREYAQIAALKR